MVAQGGRRLVNSLWIQWDSRKTRESVGRGLKVYFSWLSLSSCRQHSAPNPGCWTLSPPAFPAPSCSLSLATVSAASPYPFQEEFRGWVPGDLKTPDQLHIRKGREARTAAVVHPLPKTCNPMSDPQLCCGKHHSDVQTGPYVHVTVKARQNSGWNFVYPTVGKTQSLFSKRWYLIEWGMFMWG